MLNDRKEYAKRGFSWGKREHYFERWTNPLLTVAIILFGFAFWLRSWYLMMYVLFWLCASLCIHCVARACHRAENKWHHRR